LKFAGILVAFFSVSCTRLSIFVVVVLEQLSLQDLWIYGSEGTEQIDDLFFSLPLGCQSVYGDEKEKNYIEKLIFLRRRDKFDIDLALHIAAGYFFMELMNRSCGV
jgi:hypothetical protein